MNRALKALGKSLVIVTGVGYGVVKAMDVLAEEAGDLSRTGPAKSTKNNQNQQAPDPTVQRLDGMEQRLIRMEKSIEALAKHDLEPKVAPPVAEAPQSLEHFITRAELDRAMQRLSDDISADLEHRLEVQNRSVQSLRSMIARTDELLEQVIENIESATLTA